MKDFLHVAKTDLSADMVFFFSREKIPLFWTNFRGPNVCYMDTVVFFMMRHHYFTVKNKVEIPLSGHPMGDHFAFTFQVPKISIFTSQMVCTPFCGPKFH